MGFRMGLLLVTDGNGVEHEVQGAPGQKVMEILRDLDYGVAAVCGGMCACATCHVYVDQSWQDKLSPMQSDERDMLKELSTYRTGSSRLSCQVEYTPALDGLKLTIAPEE